MEKIPLRIILGGLALLAAALPASAQAAPEPRERAWHGHLSWCPGLKVLDSDWKPADVQFGLGLVDFDFTPAGWPVGFAGQLLMSMSRETPDATTSSGTLGFDGIGSTGTYAWNVGIRKVWRASPTLEVFAGGGVSLVGALVQLDAAAPSGSSAKDHDDDTSPGFWASAGATWAVDTTTNVGFQVEYTKGEVTLFDQDLEAGGLGLLFSLGYRW